jgi:hypothetical protein
VLVSDLEQKGHRQHRVALFTEPDSGRVNTELLHFGRAHCEGLVTQASRTHARSLEEFENGVRRQLAGWIRRVRTWRTEVPVERRSRRRWVARRLGIADPWLARALELELDADTPPPEAAATLWESVPPWPGIGSSEAAGEIGL